MLDEIYNPDNSHPPSGESSARQTPQPAPLQGAPIPNNEVVYPIYSKPLRIRPELIEYMERMSSTEPATEGPEDFHPMYPDAQQQPPTSHSNANYDQLAQTSTLKVSSAFSDHHG